MRFVAVGELLVDLVADGAGHDAQIRVRPGGSAFNAAVAAAAAGAEATAIGTVGDDPAGRMILAELAAAGVQPVVSVVEGRTGTFLLDDGEVRVDRGDSHRLGYVGPIGGDAVLVSGYLPSAARVLESAEAPWVALDTESNSMFVYRERMCLLQLNAGGRLFIVDTLE
ncbi:MAG TPA: PfkB family carbohydrate kinase, partial [Gaiellaceae bacterium]|nr:PfkB family carbohydrate kinase [Gaiellaceae bacterium]